VHDHQGPFVYIFVNLFITALLTLQTEKELSDREVPDEERLVLDVVGKDVDEVDHEVLVEGDGGEAVLDGDVGKFEAGVNHI
jgi:hypothetical protein